MDSEKKKQLGKKFEKRLIDAAVASYWGGVSWLYPKRGENNTYVVKVFDALEAFALLDEEDGVARVVIKFFKLDENKPLKVELFEIDGITKFVIDKEKITQTQEVTPYKLKITTDALETRTESDGNYDTLPVVPLYANMLHEAEFTDAFKGYADAYDFINSDLVDIITQSEGIYWAIKNFGGEDARELVETIQTWKALTADDENASAESHVLEAPYQGKQATLDSLKKEMYSDFMALDMDAITGGSLTNVAINVAKTDLDLKADELEWQVVDAVENIMALVGMEYEEPSFKRQDISDQTEDIKNISTQLSDGILDIEEAVYLSPNILESRKKDLLARLALAETEKANETFELEQDADEAVVVEDVEG